MNEDITVPRDQATDKQNKDVTKKIQDWLLDLFSENPSEPYHTKELLTLVKREFAQEYGYELEAHTAWALDMLHFNNMIKRVAPATYESIDGTDPVHTERETGHSPEGEFSARGFDVKKLEKATGTPFRQKYAKAELSVKMLKNMGYNEERILAATQKDFDPVAVKLAIKKLFHQGETLE